MIFFNKGTLKKTRIIKLESSDSSKGAYRLMIQCSFIVFTVVHTAVYTLCTNAHTKYHKKN